MSIAAWQGAKSSFTHLVRSVSLSKSDQIVQLADSSCKFIYDCRVGRRTKRSHVMTNGLLDSSKLVKGFDNSGSKWRWNGCKNEFNFVDPAPGYYCSTVSRYGQFSAVASEFGYYENLSSGLKPQQVEYWKPSRLFPPDTVLIDLSTPKSTHHTPPIRVFEPFDESNLQWLEVIFGTPVMAEMTEQLLCINFEAPESERIKYISKPMDDELRIIKSSKRGVLTLKSLMTSPSYGLSSLVGNACLGAEIGIVAPSARASDVPQQAFLDGSSNVVLPVKKDNSTSLVLNGVWDFVPDSKGKGKFEYTDASRL